MATTYIGKPISLLSHSDVRYRGILAGVDQVNSTIQLQNVYSVGTEDRRPQAEFIPPAEQPYQFIIFRASEVKDIALDYDTFDPPPRVRSVHDDPAVIGVQGPPVANYAQDAQYHVQQPAQTVPASLGTRPPPQQAAVPPAGAATGEQTQSQQQSSGGRSGRRTGSGQRDSSANSGSVNTAAASLEKVERALGDLRLSNAQARSSANNPTNGARSRRAGGVRQGQGQPQQQNVEIKVPTTDFDFETANARFDKSALTSAQGKTTTPSLSDDEKTNPSDEERDAASANPSQSQSDAKEKEKEKDDSSYNPKKSFFDTLSSSATSLPPHQARGGNNNGNRGGRGRGYGKSRREEEREKNVATFGEPGGVGLMGPGAYVGGYGGYGRRGGRGGRRGGPRRPQVDNA